MSSVSQLYARTELITPQGETESIRDVACVIDAPIAHKAKPVAHVIGGREARTVQINALTSKQGARAHVAIAAEYFNSGGFKLSSDPLCPCIL